MHVCACIYFVCTQPLPSLFFKPSLSEAIERVLGGYTILNSSWPSYLHPRSSVFSKVGVEWIVHERLTLVSTSSHSLENCMSSASPKSGDQGRDGGVVHKRNDCGHKRAQTPQTLYGRAWEHSAWFFFILTWIFLKTKSYSVKIVTFNRHILEKLFFSVANYIDFPPKFPMNSKNWGKSTLGRSIGNTFLKWRILLFQC